MKRDITEIQNYAFNYAYENTHDKNGKFLKQFVDRYKGMKQMYCSGDWGRKPKYLFQYYGNGTDSQNKSMNDYWTLKILIDYESYHSYGKSEEVMIIFEGCGKHCWASWNGRIPEDDFSSKEDNVYQYKQLSEKKLYQLIKERQ